MTGRVLTGIWLAALLALLGWVTRTTSVFARRDVDVTAPPPLARLDARLLSVMTLGYRGLYDDVADIWLLQMLVDERTRQADPAVVQKTIETVTRHHPRLESLYMVACFTLAFDLGRPEGCERVTLDGLKAFPDSWRIPVTQGFLYAYKMNQPKNAALYYGLAASRPDAPEFLKKLTANLVERNGLTTEDLQATVDQLLGPDGGARFGAFLRGLGQTRKGSH